MSQDISNLCEEALGCYDYMHRAYKQALSLLREGGDTAELQAVLAELAEPQERLTRLEPRLKAAGAQVPAPRVRALETAARECAHLNAQLTEAVSDRLTLLGSELADSARVGEALSGYRSGK